MVAKMAMTISMLGLSLACQRPGVDEEGSGSASSSNSSDGGSSGESTSSGVSTTGEPFDATRWLGRYHYENIFLPFGERGEAHGSRVLANFEISSDSTATLFFDDCDLPDPIVNHYRWEPDEQDWLRLLPGEGESSLGLVALENLETLRVHLVDSCRELELEADGAVVQWFPLFPGESCWVDRCTTPGIMQVDYCEGEEPPPCP
jgi:hypothetical protein